MQAIKDLCKKVNNISMTLSENPLSAVLMLGNAYCALKQANILDKELLTQTLIKLKTSLTEKQIHQLWQTILSISPYRLNLMTTSNQKAINRLKYEMICDIKYFKYINQDDLIKGGCHAKFYRFVLIALIRQNLQSKGLVDPFEEDKFTYQALKQAGPEQSEYLAGFIKKNSLPSTDVFQALGSKSCIARLLLIDLKACQQIFEISSAFAHQHSALRKEIAENWKCYLETYPLSTLQQNFLSKELPKLKQKYPEFNIVELNNRAKRNNEIKMLPHHKSFCRVIFEGGVGGVVSSVGLSSGLAQLGFALSMPACAVSLPICIGMNVGLNWMFGRAKGTLQSELKHPLLQDIVTADKVVSEIDKQYRVAGCN